LENPGKTSHNSGKTSQYSIILQNLAKPQTTFAKLANIQ
jgi:hypothetical protein